jgi:prepilin signal peptidase PulO-like enzyme (type II secretory pathway)
MSHINYFILVSISLIYGVLLGNYLTTAYHRIPLNKPINGLTRERGIKPHCSVCKHELRYYEYYPILSWVFTRQKCNYCKASVDIAYTALEVGMMIMSLLLFSTFGMNVFYVLFTLFISTFVLLFALYIKYRKLYFKSVCFVLISGAILILGGRI